MSKTLSTLVEDLKSLLMNGPASEVDDQVYVNFGKQMEALLRRRVEGFGKPREFSLSLSKIGKPDTELWFDKNGYEGEPLRPETFLKFLYGDVTEELMLSLCEAAGHTVERRQEEVEYCGVKGHIDAIIDGELVDVKSASSYGFDKFSDGTLAENDSFGYIPQLSGYANALKKDTGYFLAFDKTLGHFCIMKMEAIDQKERIEQIKRVLESDTPPVPKCSIKVEKNGNEILKTPCSYCRFKQHCHPGLRTFVYASGPVFMTKVVSEPRVAEVGRVPD